VCASVCTRLVCASLTSAKKTLSIDTIFAKITTRSQGKNKIKSGSYDCRTSFQHRNKTCKQRRKSATYSSFFTKNKVAKIDDVSSSSSSPHLQEDFLLQSLLLLLVMLTNGYSLAVLPNSRKTISRPENKARGLLLRADRNRSPFPAHTAASAAAAVLCGTEKTRRTRKP
jgi:hypothetical protein